MAVVLCQSVYCQSCDLYPNNQGQIFSLGIKTQKIFQEFADGKRVLRWAYEFDSAGKCIRYIMRDQNGNSNRYYFSTNDRNSDGSYSCVASGYFDKDSVPVISSSDESYYDFAAQRLGLTIKVFNSAGVITRSVTIPVYDEKNNIVFQNYYKFNSGGDTIEMNECKRNGSNETIVWAEKKADVWIEKQKNINTYDTSGKIATHYSYLAGRLSKTMLYTRTYNTDRLMTEETVRDENGRLVQKSIVVYCEGSDKICDSKFEEYKNGVISARTVYARDHETRYYFENGELMMTNVINYPVSDPVPKVPYIDEEVKDLPKPQKKIAVVPLTISQLLTLKYKKQPYSIMKPEIKKRQPETIETYADALNKTGLSMIERFNEYGLITERSLINQKEKYIWEYAYFKK